MTTTVGSTSSSNVVIVDPVTSNALDPRLRGNDDVADFLRTYQKQHNVLCGTSQVPGTEIYINDR
jgi:hypothetical protein